MDYDKDDFIRALCSYDMAINPESLIIEIKKILDGDEFESVANYENYELPGRDEINKRIKHEFPFNNDGPFFVNYESATDKNPSGLTKNIIQLRKILIMSFYYKYWFCGNFDKNKDDNKAKKDFLVFITKMDILLKKMNLPELYILDDFDRAMIIASVLAAKAAFKELIGSKIIENTDNVASFMFILFLIFSL